MKKLFFILIAIASLLVVSCSKETGGSGSKKFQGTWVFEFHGTDKSYIRTSFTFLRSGVVTGDEYRYIGRTGTEGETTYTGTWEMDDDNTIYFECSYVTEKTTSSGKVSYDTGITHGTMTYKDNSLIRDGGDVYKKQ